MAAARRTPPAGLRTPGKGAFKRALAALEAREIDPTHYMDTIVRYARAVDDEEGARAMWVSAGRPTIGHGGATGSAEVEHVLVKIVRDAAKHANDIGKQLGLDPNSVQRAVPKKVPGRPMGGASSPDRQFGKMDPEPGRVMPLRAVQAGDKA